MRGVRAAVAVGLGAGSALCAVALWPTGAQAATGTPSPTTSATASAASSASPLRQASWVVWLDLEAGRLAVEQDVELANSGTTSYAGQGSAAGLPADKHPVLRLPIAVGGTNLQYVGQFEGCCAVVDGRSLVLSQPVKPGTSQGTVRYEVPFTPRLDLTVPLPTDSLVVLVPPGLRLDAPRLSASGTSTDRGVTYQAYRTSTLTPGTTIELALARAPAQRPTSVGRWAAGAVGAVLAVGGALFLLRRRRLGATGRQPKDGLTGRMSRSTRSPIRTPTGSRDGNAELLVEEIALLDLAFEQGAVSDEAVYRRVRAAVMQRLMASEAAAEPVRAETGRR